jgi:DNA-binding response OmpR family regulator
MSHRVPLIYVADDDEPTLELIDVLLSRDGLEVVGFASADRLIAAVPTRRPDAVLLDVRIPGLSGLDALKALKDSDAADIPVLMLTGDGRLDRIVQAMQLGAKGYVMKPFDGPKLVGEVRAILKPA